MAKFRTNHTRQGRGRAGGTTRLLLLAVFMAAALVAGLRYVPVLTTSQRPSIIPISERFFLPATDPSTTVRHFDFGAVGEKKGTNDLLWVAYPVYGAPYGQEEGESTSLWMDPKDLWYLDSETRMIWADSVRIPSLPKWASSWTTLQTFVRKEATFSSPIYVCDGPVLPSIDRSDLDNPAVPSGFFKVLLDLEPIRGIGFWINSEEPRPMVFPIDTLEALTGIDFFHELLLDSLENKMESHLDSVAWSTYFINAY